MASVASASEPDIEPTEVKSPELHVPTSAAAVTRAPRMDEETFGSWDIQEEDLYKRQGEERGSPRPCRSKGKRHNYFVKSTGCQAQMTVVVMWDAAQGFHVKVGGGMGSLEGRAEVYDGAR
eukprot:jgi/Phyca11/21690/fgenesh1_pg.PHYCAscaffold_107_\